MEVIARTLLRPTHRIAVAGVVTEVVVVPAVAQDLVGQKLGRLCFIRMLKFSRSRLSEMQLNLEQRHNLIFVTLSYATRGRPQRSSQRAA